MPSFACFLLAGWIGDSGLEAHSNWPNFYSAKSAISVGADGLQAAVVIEIPTFSLVPRFRKHFEHLDLMKEIEEGRFEKLEAEFRAVIFERLGQGLSLLIAGKPVAGRWLPVKTPINGKANEGFFVYMLEFEPSLPLELGTRLEAEIHNELYPEENIILTGSVEATEGWAVVESSAPLPPPATDLSSGSKAEIDLWSTDPALRRFRVVVERKPG